MTTPIQHGHQMSSMCWGGGAGSDPDVLIDPVAGPALAVSARSPVVDAGLTTAALRKVANQTNPSHVESEIGSTSDLQKVDK